MRSPTEMFTFMEVASDSFRFAPIASSHARTRVVIWERVEEVNNNDCSKIVASGHRVRASLTDVEMPLLPLVANRAIRFPASFEA